MLGLALEGGGAKGAFHMGAVRAFKEEGYEFRGVAGTSIGAINGALIAQGDFEPGYRLWETMDSSLIFDIETTVMQKVMNKKIDKASLVYLSAKIRELLENRGLDTSKIRQILERMIDEDKLRKSDVVFGIVTVSVSDLKPLELYKEDIPLGKMTDYLMASANFPVFKLEPLEGKYYVDGGFYDNCPINLLIRKGFREIVAVRTLGLGRVRKVETENVTVTNILPSEELGNVLNFDNKLILRNLKMGYYDSLRVLKGLKGRGYYLEPFDERRIFEGLLTLPDEIIAKAGQLMLIPPMEPRRMLFEKILPSLAVWLRLPGTTSYPDILLSLIELAAAARKIEKYQIYRFSRFLEAIQTAPEVEPKSVRPISVKMLGTTRRITGPVRNSILHQISHEFLNALCNTRVFDTL